MFLILHAMYTVKTWRLCLFASYVRKSGMLALRPWLVKCFVTGSRRSGAQPSLVSHADDTRRLGPQPVAVERSNVDPGCLGGIGACANVAADPASDQVDERVVVAYAAPVRVALDQVDDIGDAEDANVQGGLFVDLSTGCGGTLYAVKANSASSRLETAQALGAEKYAPYEYFYAKEHLAKAMEEAAAADYGDAIDFADTAAEYADKAIVLAKQAHEGAGR